MIIILKMKKAFITFLAILLGFSAVALIKPAPKSIANPKSMEDLGQLIFEDTALSDPPGISCASCHDPKNGFQGNNKSSIAAVARGSREGHFGARNTPTIAYSSYSPPFEFVAEKNDKGEVEYTPTGGQFLDGRASDLASQMEFPLTNADEMNMASKGIIVEKVKEASYAPLFRQLFGADVFQDEDKAFQSIGIALASFEGSPLVNKFSSKFDDVLKGNDTFTGQEARGFDVFKDPEKGNCIACHVGNEKSKSPEDWLFTDFTYDNLGVPRNPDLPANAKSDAYDLGLCARADIQKILPKGIKADDFCGAFKVPTLRNIAVTAPYMHNGSIKTLQEAVSFYVTRNISPERWYRQMPGSNGRRQYDDLPEKYHGNVNTSEVPYDRKYGEKPRLNEQEIEDLTIFLKTLTDK